jgi:hypothetical protein
MAREAATFAAVYARMVTIPQDGEWIEVDSAFGGLAIYRRDCLRHARYIGLNKTGREICEHVPFHMALRKRGSRIFVNPKLINCAYTEHSRRVHQRRPRVLEASAVAPTPRALRALSDRMRLG